MNKEEFKLKFFDMYTEMQKAYKNSLPLCAAENCMSPFAKLPLSSFIQEKYIMGGTLKYDDNNNFINSEKIFPIYNLINELCFELFSCDYADARTLSGVNAVLTMLMSIFEAGDTILISDENCGGHGSMPKLCKRLGIRTISMPYDFKNHDFDYNSINNIIDNERIDGILVCLSDMIIQPKLKNINIGNNIALIYDATQIFGLIATGHLENPFQWFSKKQKFILLGATHKTIPGPTNGLILCNNIEFARTFDTKTNPDYLRNNQLHQILSLVFTLQELSLYGTEYSQKIIDNANILGALLNEKGFDVIKIDDDLYSATHQVCFHLEKEVTYAFKARSEFYDITLNARYKHLYKGSGIRLGLQEISRYGWGVEELEKIAVVLSLMKNEIINHENHELEIRGILEKLNSIKKINFLPPKEYIQIFEKLLHNS